MLDTKRSKNYIVQYPFKVTSKNEFDIKTGIIELWTVPEKQPGEVDKGLGWFSMVSENKTQSSQRNNLEKWIKDLVGSAWFLRTKHRVHQLEQGTNSSSTTPSTLKQ